ncbi:hypothetical protein DPMN_108625 [Dreissena polymorpha]|uniref:Uncharacterized protein n=1 Tax=Dreissena polymorpha TaxID=45954 RepID=A0A9D4QM83_DREPO|nr:hypothetical protein DPMN_108625 [Dreissena polymorpha]
MWACIIMVEWALELLSTYHDELKPTNPYDSMAVAVFDGLRKIGTLKRDCAKAVNEISLNKGKSRYLLRPLEEPIVRNRRTGPQQTCAIAFKIDESDISMVTTTAQMHTCIYIKVMELK